MRILIENANEVEYLTDQGQWTKKPCEAACFASTGAACEVAKKQPIHEFNIVQFFGLNGQFINLDHGTGASKETRPVQPISQSQESTVVIARQEPAPTCAASRD
jgi:hypothetical protein